MKAIAMDMDFDDPVSSTANLQHHLIIHFNLGPANSSEFSPSVFTGTLISQPTPSSVTTCVTNMDRSVTTTTLVINTLASRAETIPFPCYFPLRRNLHQRRHFLKIQIFPYLNILNTFYHCWFLSVDSLRAQALLA